MLEIDYGMEGSELTQFGVSFPDTLFNIDHWPMKCMQRVPYVFEVGMQKAYNLRSSDILYGYAPVEMERKDPLHYNYNGSQLLEHTYEVFKGGWNFHPVIPASEKTLKHASVRGNIAVNSASTPTPLIGESPFNLYTTFQFSKSSKGLVQYVPIEDPSSGVVYFADDVMKAVMYTSQTKTYMDQIGGGQVDLYTGSSYQNSFWNEPFPSERPQNFV